jgi:hypothetical protein
MSTVPSRLESSHLCQTRPLGGLILAPLSLLAVGCPLELGDVELEHAHRRLNGAIRASRVRDSEPLPRSPGVAPRRHLARRTRLARILRDRTNPGARSPRTASELMRLDRIERGNSSCCGRRELTPTMRRCANCSSCWNRASNLRFDINDMPATGGSATLYLYGTFVRSGPPVRVRACAVGDQLPTAVARHLPTYAVEARLSIA